MMENRYKIILSNNIIYREIELAKDSQQIRVGTGVECDIRLRKELFFEPIELVFYRSEDVWSVQCSDNLYITVGDVRKLMTKTLEHGDSFEVKYQESDNLVFAFDFLLDFDSGEIKYERIIDVSNVSDITIGVSAKNDIGLKSDYVKRDEITLHKQGDAYQLDIKETTYGVYINGKKAKAGDTISNRDFLSVSDFFFYLKDEKIFTEIRDGININSLNYVDKPIPNLYPKFNRNTRVKTIVSDEKIEILDPPAKPQKPKNNLFMRLLPSIGMLVAAGVMAYFGGAMIIMSAISAGMAIFTTVMSIKEGNKEYKESSLERVEKYTAYIKKKREEIEQARQDELEEMEIVYISQEKEKERITEFSAELFDRNKGDEDYLCIRLGSGDIESKRKVNYKRQERLEIEDELQQIPEQIYEEYKYVHDAPIVCDLKEINALGIIGAEENRYELFRNLVIDIAVRHFFSDVKLFFVVNHGNREKVQWLRLLPHVYNEVLGIRNIISDDESKNLIFEYLYKELTIREQNKSYDKNFIIFFYDECGFKSHPISKFVDKAKELGITFVFFGEDRAEIPVGCGYLISIKEEGNADLIDTTNKGMTTSFIYHSILEKEATQIVNLLAPVYTEEISLEGTLTKNISMYELLNIIAVDDLDLESRWAKSQVYKSMEAPLGISKTGIVSLDLHDKAHGPHGLVAGTTGSGKSEILQTYILAMATLFHPYEVGFVIIDFKGGGMVNQFKDLPHLMGAITNIDGKEINRSLKSIKAELQKRQRLFADADVNHIDKYIRKYKMGEVNQPLPHLIIIVDEFAELKAEQPEFMKELISAARIGRSLGVHLILATQKPSGQVNEQIWSNSKFKLCLKVQSQEDSNEVIKSPLAAEIKEPGRAYLQVGNNEIFELFQSAYSGSSEKAEDSNVKEFTIYTVTESGKKIPVYSQKRKKGEDGGSTQLDAIVRYVREYCDEKEIRGLSNICIESLKEVVEFTEEDTIRQELFSIGIYDNPDNQYQGNAYIDINNKNTFVIGSAQYGKTNLIQLLIRQIVGKYSSDEANIYIIDFGSMVLKNFESLSHVGGVVCSSEDEKLKNLFKLLQEEIIRRKELLVAVGVSSYSAYKEAGYKDLPRIYLFIDNMTALIELYLENDDTLLAIIREGVAVGISTIVVNLQTTGISYKYLSNFANKIALYCNNTNEYNNIFDHVSIQPEDIKGRCIIEIDKRVMECQTYLAFNGEKEYERVENIKEFIVAQNATNQGRRAKVIPFIPSVLTNEVLQNEFNAFPVQYSLPIGISYKEVMPFYLDFAKLGAIGICGKEKKGHYNFISNIIYTFTKCNDCNHVKICVFDDISRKYKDLKEVVDLYTLNPEDVVNVLLEWHQILEDRYLAMLEERNAVDTTMLLLIIQNNDVAKFIYEDMDLMNCYRDMVTRYKNLNVAIIYSNYENAAVSYDAPEPLRMIKMEQHLLCFDDLDNLKVFDVPYEELRSNKKKLQLGDAYYIKDNAVTKVKMTKCIKTN